MIPRKIRKVFFIWISGLLTLSPFARGTTNEFDGLTSGQIYLIEREARNYFDSNLVGPHQFDALTLSAPVISLLFSEAKNRLLEDPFDRSRRERVYRLIEYLARAAPKVTPPSRGSAAHARIYHDGQRLLVLTSRQSKTVQAVSRIFDIFQLWTVDQIDFLIRQSTTMSALADNADRIYRFLPKMTDHQLEDLAHGLRRISPPQTLQLSLLMATGHMTPPELVTFLDIASEQFARALLRWEEMGGDDDAHLLIEIQDERNRIITTSFNHIIVAMKDGQGTMRAAFKQARNHAEKARPTSDYRRGDRLLFFSLLREGRLNWYDRTSWLRAIEPMYEPTFRPKPKYSADGNILHVEFGAGRGDCSDELS